MITFHFTNQAQKTFLRLPKIAQERIIEKLKELKTHDDILSVLKRLTNFEPATHRLRIGMYRLILELKSRSQTDFDFWILDVGNRKDIYH